MIRAEPSLYPGIFCHVFFLTKFESLSREIPSAIRGSRFDDLLLEIRRRLKVSSVREKPMFILAVLLVHKTSAVRLVVLRHADAPCCSFSCLDAVHDVCLACLPHAAGCHL